jgi:hypothetical protein
MSELRKIEPEPEPAGGWHLFGPAPEPPTGGVVVQYEPELEAG